MQRECFTFLFWDLRFIYVLLAQREFGCWDKIILNPGPCEAQPFALVHLSLAKTQTTLLKKMAESHTRQQNINKPTFLCQEFLQNMLVLNIF